MATVPARPETEQDRRGSGKQSSITRIARGAARRARDLRSRPDFVTDLLQIIKAVIAGTSAWWFAVYVLESPLPFLAPWTALLTVHATVHRSFSHGVQTTVASAIGVAISFVIGSYLGVSVWTFALALFIGVAAARIRWIKDEGIAIATTAIFVLGSGFSEQEPLLDERLFEVGVGVAAGIAVNLLIVPPLRDRQAARHVDRVNERMGEVLTDMADEFSASWETDKEDSWFQETESISAELSSAWSVVRFARESRRQNPRGFLPLPGRASRRARRERHGEQVSYEEILGRSDEGISHLRLLARTLREASYAEGSWDEKFRERWVAIVRDTGEAIADPDAPVEPINDRLVQLASDMSDDDELPRDLWPTYGSLITSVRHIVIIVDDVASAREAREATRQNPKT
ncbi:FUSC family protein [Nesterenkonia populi]